MILEFIRNTMAMICDDSKLSSEGKTIFTRLCWTEMLLLGLLFFGGWYMQLTSLKHADQAVPHLVMLVISICILPIVMLFAQYPFYLYCKATWPNTGEEKEDPEIEFEIDGTL